MDNTTANTAPATPSVEGNQPIDPEAPKPGERVFEIKYPDGTTQKRGESWLLQRAQKSIGLEKKVSDGAKYEAAFTNFVSRVQNPTQLYELLNHPDLKYDEEKQEALVKAMLGSKKPRIIEAVKRWIYDNEVKPSLMDPKDRELMEIRSEADQLRQEKLERDKQAKEQKEIEEVNQIKDNYRIQLSEAYKSSGLPVQDFLVRQVLEKARLFISNRQQPDFKKCCELVQQDFLAQVKSILGTATVDNILNYLDGETAKTVNKALLKAVDRKANEVESSGESTPRKKKVEKQMTSSERKKWLRNLEHGIID